MSTYAFDRTKAYLKKKKIIIIIIIIKVVTG